ncbi:MAG: GNAT family N-acetyltransferase [Bacillota bacterium]|nr:GNAT family N-acetyltransferase [Bacillota bacterium]
MDDVYKIITPEEKHLPEMYSWNKEEKNFNKYTCRPLCTLKTYEEYKDKILNSIKEEKDKLFILVKKSDQDIPLGRIKLFDYNPRNHSAEFGYYLPERNRGMGLGSIMINLLLTYSFMDRNINLNKLYATTASNNNPSIKALEKAGFKLEGRLREHYWMDEDKFDQLVYSMLRKEWDEK